MEDKKIGRIDLCAVPLAYIRQAKNSSWYQQTRKISNELQP